MDWCFLMKNNHKVRTYKEYHSVCPSSELGLPPTPHPQASVPPPPCFWGEGNTRWRERGWESPNSDEGHTLWYSLYVRTLWEQPSRWWFCSGLDRGRTIQEGKQQRPGRDKADNQISWMQPLLNYVTSESPFGAPKRTTIDLVLLPLLLRQHITLITVRIIYLSAVLKFCFKIVFFDSLKVQ